VGHQAITVFTVKNWLNKTPQKFRFTAKFPKVITEDHSLSRTSLKEFDESEDLLSLAKDTKFIDYKKAQTILVGAREGRDAVKHEIGI